MKKIVVDTASFVAFLDLLKQPSKDATAPKEQAKSPSVLKHGHRCAVERR